MKFSAVLLVVFTATSTFAQESGQADYEKVVSAVLAADDQPIFWQGDDLTLITAMIDDRYSPENPEAIIVGFYGDSFDFKGVILVDENRDGKVDFLAINNHKEAADRSHQFAFDQAIGLLAKDL